MFKKCSEEQRHLSKRKGIEWFIQSSIKEHGNKYDYSISKYITIHDNIDIICPLHGKFNQRAGNHIRGQGCPICKESHGEKRIRLYLENKNVKYKKEFKFEDCRGDKRPLPFDFYLPEHNTCIEYDGRQHFEESFYGKGDRFIKRKRLDEVKNCYCVNNNINLIRIPYWDLDKIEKTLSNFISINNCK